jgi:hypothetical protein
MSNFPARETVRVASVENVKRVYATPPTVMLEDEPPVATPYPVAPKLKKVNVDADKQSK